MQTGKYPIIRLSIEAYRHLKQLVEIKSQRGVKTDLTNEASQAILKLTIKKELNQ